jgi:hypothetical protein
MEFFLAAILAADIAPAQSGSMEPPPEFEVASVKLLRALHP